MIKRRRPKEKREGRRPSSCPSPALSAGLAARGGSAGRAESIPVVFRFERAVPGDPDVLCLLRAELGQLGAELVEMQLGDLLVEMLRQHIDLVLVLAVIGPQLELRQYLVGERGAHHKARMAGGAAEI